MKVPIPSLEPLFPDRKSSEPLTSQLVRRLRSSIETGAFPLGTRLLPTRQLATQLGLARNTVTAAIDQLVAEGYLEARVGSGTFVAHNMPLSEAPAVTRQPPPRATRFYNAEDTARAFGACTGPLRLGVPDPTLFPTTAWNRAARACARQKDVHIDYAPASGVPDLRRAIAAHVRQFRGVTTHPDDVIIVASAQDAFNLIALTLSSPNNRIVMEDPCYALARDLFAAHDLQIVPSMVDSDGLNTNDLPSDAVFAYVTPSHQFPLGGVMSLKRRHELLSWASASEAYIVEDDYDSEFAFSARPQPALQSLDRRERVIYVGTFSKSLAPGIRTAYIIVPPHLRRAFISARIATCLGSPAYVQSALAKFLLDGDFARHVRRMTRVYERRRKVLLDVLRVGLPPDFRIGPSSSGLHLAAIGPADFDDITAATCGAQRLFSLSMMCITRTDVRGFVLGYAAESNDSIRAAATEVCQAISLLGKGTHVAP